MNDSPSRPRPSGLLRPAGAAKPRAVMGTTARARHAYADLARLGPTIGTTTTSCVRS